MRQPSLATASTVTVTVGGDDIHFGDGLAGCAAPGAACGPALRTWLPQRVADLAPKLEATDRSILANALPDTELVVVGYPRTFPKNPARGACPALVRPNGGGFDVDEQAAYRRAGKLLRAAMRDAAAAAGATFVDVVSTFAGHEVCAADEDWLASGSSAVTAGAFYPAAGGQRAYARAVRSGL